MSWGLSERVINNIHSILKKYPSVEKVVLYGSRAKGNFKKGSDIDLVLFGSELDNHVIYKIKSDLEDSDIPYFVDVEIFDNIENSKLREHIERVGAVFYEGNKAMTKKDSVTSLPTNWEMKKLGEVCVKTEKIDPTRNPDKIFVYLDVAAVNKETKQIEEVTQILGKDAPSRARKLIKTNDVIFATVRPTHGRVALIPKELNEQVCSTGYFVLRGKANFVNKYLYYFLQTDEFNSQMEKLQKGASYPAVTDTEVKNILIRYPTNNSEQKKIVTILDKCFTSIDRAIAIAEMNLKNSREIFTSYLSSIFNDGGENWEVKSLGEVCDNIITGPFGSMLHKSDYVENGIPVVNPQNIVQGDIISLAKTMIDKELFFKLVKYSLQLDDIVIARRGEMGRAAVVRHKNVGWLCGTGSFIIRVNKKKVNSDFLNIILNSDTTKKILEKTSIGATMNNLNQNLLSEIVLFLPPISEQKKIVAQLDALRSKTQKLEEHYSSQLNYLADLKKSILQKAFSGGITK